MWKALGSFVELILEIFRKYFGKQEEARRQEREAHVRVEKSNQQIANGRYRDVSNDLDRAMDDIDAHERLRKTTPSSGGSDTESGE